MLKIIYPVANKLVLPIFPFFLTILLQHYDGDGADNFFFLYSLSLTISVFSDFGFRFYPYRAPLSESFLFEKYKFVFSLLSVLLYFLVIFLLGYWTVCGWVFGFMLPFYGLCDVGNHVMKSHGFQRKLFRISWLSWVFSLFSSLPFLLSGLQMYFVFSLFLSNLMRYLAVFYFLRQYRVGKIVNRCSVEFDLWQGFSLLLFMLKNRLPFILYPVIYSLNGLAMVGIVLGVIGKLSEVGVALFEIKHRESPRINYKEVGVFTGVLVVLTFVYIFLSNMVGILDSSPSFIVAIFFILLFSFFNQYNRMYFFSNKRSNEILLFNAFLVIIIPGLLLAFGHIHTIVYCVLVVEAVTFVFYSFKKGYDETGSSACS